MKKNNKISKIDSVIRKYLVEREDVLLNNTNEDDIYNFTEETKKTFGDMVSGLTDTIDDLEIIKMKEGDVVIDEDFYAEDHIGEIIDFIESVIDKLEYLKDLK